MKNVKLLTAAALILAATGAYAGTDDGNVQGNNVSNQVPANVQAQKVQAPAPAASAAELEHRTTDSGIVSPLP